MRNKGILASVAAISLALLPAVSARTAKKSSTAYAQFRIKLAKRDKILHALDRLTFGPRPGDYA
ncbi:MAG: hypothetical protein ACREH9_05305, partial [Pseudomonadota bacterium]